MLRADTEGYSRIIGIYIKNSIALAQVIVAICRTLSISMDLTCLVEERRIQARLSTKLIQRAIEYVLKPGSS